MSNTGYVRNWLLHEPSTECSFPRGPQIQAVTQKRNIYRPVVVRGLPGIGKTTLANELEYQFCEALGKNMVFRINADEVRASICKDLGFSEEDRAVNARRIGGLVRLAALQGFQVVADFVMPTGLSVLAYVGATKDLKSQIFSLEPPVDFRSRFKDTTNLWQSSLEWEADLPSGEEIWPIKPYAPTQVGAVASDIVHHCLVQTRVEL